MIKEIWMYQIGEGEIWTSDHYATREEAIEAVKKEFKETEAEGLKCYVGKVQDYEPFINGEGVLETIQECAYDDCGEVAEYYLDSTREQIEELEDELNQVFKKWIQKYHENDRLGEMVDVEEVNV